MKQTISIQDLQGLSEKGKERLVKWYEEKKGTHWISSTEVLVDGVFLPQMSIGELIEFLDEHDTNGYLLEGYSISGHYGKDGEPELCDLLWKDVKEILESEE